jgi:hypothetical protein
MCAERMPGHSDAGARIKRLRVPSSGAVAAARANA